MIVSISKGSQDVEEIQARKYCRRYSYPSEKHSTLSCLRLSLLNFSVSQSPVSFGLMVKIEVLKINYSKFVNV